MSFLPLPKHFNPGTVDRIWRVDYAQRAEDARRWARDHGVAPAAGDAPRVGLLLVDCQNTFCIPDHELFVGGRSGRGAVDDNIRLCEFIYRNLHRITEITVTLDTHTAIQIFHPLFWTDAHGNHPVGAQTVITLDDLESGRWTVNPAIIDRLQRNDVERLDDYVRHYVQTLEGRYPLMVWPYHAMLGGIGHALVSAVEEAVFFHAVARHAVTRFETKGDNPLTENYSVLRPEVLADANGRPIARPNAPLVDHLLSLDALIVAGQAKSHCVAWTVNDLLTEIAERDPTLAKRICLLQDCSSPVVVPGVVDFTDEAERAYRRFAEAGINVIASTNVDAITAAWTT